MEAEKEKSAFYLWRGRMTSGWKKKQRHLLLISKKTALNVGTAVVVANAHRGLSLRLNILKLCFTFAIHRNKKKKKKTNASLPYLIIKIINFKTSSHVFWKKRKKKKIISWCSSFTLQSCSSLSDRRTGSYSALLIFLQERTSLLSK